MESNTHTNLVKEQYPPPVGMTGLGGWLILVQITLYFSFISLLIGVPALFLMFDGEVWEAVTSPDSIHYNVLWGVMIVFQLSYYVLLLLFTGYILVQFYRKKAMLPRLMIIFYAAPVVFGAIDLLIMYQIPLAVELDEGDSLKGTVRSLITCAIWIPYFIKSERVRYTFVK